ncbi:Beta-lactamase/transpeptidase-like [Syntrophomonas zehnderi OL-4]|uniref:Beta-lactamase/transpeptidase-like n=1 Tax=Syntrophomonas zehnderi OL-4 TaxID=690567 RepID=A0A0E4C7X5_9FIRM|nr:penicillin-binding protein 2 [Syntrophomonas zehnderi]CFX16621.1 Beta-lactamase/transpeptidase-like [Syntrophomonas zehnderi OL-4]
MQKKRLYLLMGFLLFLWGFLFTRLFYCQIIQGHRISQEVTKMRSREIDMRELPRGEILDRHLVPLTDYLSSPALYCLPRAITSQHGSRSKAYKELAHFLAARLQHADAKKIEADLKKASVNKTAIIRLCTNLSSEEREIIQAAHNPALVVAPYFKRYPENGFMAHLLGYAIKEEKPEQINGTGLERDYYQLLDNSSSQYRLLTALDARGNMIPGLSLRVGNQDSIKNALVLTIDKRVQKLVEEIMNQRIAKGAVVVLDVKSKEVLAMASRPTYIQNQVEEYLADVDSPLINRVLTPYYPGSLFKIVISLAAGEENLVKTGEVFNCTGKYSFNNQVAISCLKKEGHGDLSFEEAFAKSCNPTFINVGLRLGRSRLLEYVERLHLTDPELRGMQEVQSGTYVQIDGGEAALGNVCVGQRGVMLSPLQIASLLATVADDGFWAPPVVVKYTLDGEGKKSAFSPYRKKKVIKTTTAQGVQRMMEKVVEEGSGQNARLSDLRVAGKTATSQTGQINKNGEEILNTWFAGYLPADSPRWVIVVLAEEGQSGAQNCAPVFKDICQGMLQISP